MKCQTCKFLEVLLPTWGRCHRYAPKPGDMEWSWPEVDMDEFCGEYLPNAIEAETEVLDKIDHNPT